MDVQNLTNIFSRINEVATPAEVAADAHLATGAQVAPSNRAFANLLDQAIEARPQPQPTTEESAREKVIRAKAQMIVNQFFVGTMLKQMRQSPFKSEVFSGGRGGEAYQGMMDQHLAEHAGNRLAKSLVDSLVKSYRKQKGDPAQLFTDPKQQKQFEDYRQKVKHDVAADLTA